MEFRLSDFSNKKFVVLLFLGYSSGLPFGLLHGTLQNWFADSNVDIVTIGCLSLLGLPYVFKVFWSPFLDRFVPPFLGRRRGWILLTQILLFATVGWMGFFSPNNNPGFIALIALIVSFASATQDIAIDAYRTDILQPVERGVGAAVAVTGFRLAILLTGGIALIMADHIGWQLTWMLLALSLFLTILSTFIAPEPIQRKRPASLKEAVVEPMREFCSRESAGLLLLLVLLYKLSDAFAMIFTGPFLIHLDFSLTQIGVVTKIMGVLATLFGLFLGGALMIGLGLFRSLLLFGILQSLSNLLFMLLASVGQQFFLMATAVFFENICEGMATAAFIAFLMSLCDHRFSAVQFALLSSLAAVGRELVGPLGGLIIAHYGWTNFYFLTVLAGIPGLIFLILIKQRIGSEISHRRQAQVL